jgi:hypothetical protein
MATTYKFKVTYTRLGVSASPTSAPTIDIVDTDADTKLITAGSTVSKTNLIGYYEREYNGADSLDLVGLFHTTDTTIDQQDLTSYTSDILTTNLNTPVGSIADNISGSIVEGAITLKQALRLLLAVTTGKVTGGGTTTITFRDTADGTNRVVATVDSNGNRSAITLNAD